MLTRHKDFGERLTASEGMALLISQITYKSYSFSVKLFKSGLSARCCRSGDKGKPVF